MRIAVIDDYEDAFRKLECYAKLKGHDVQVFHDTEKDPGRLAERLKDAEAVILTQQRTRFPRAVVERLAKLKLVSQTGRNANHIDHRGGRARRGAETGAPGLRRGGRVRG